MHGVQTIIPVKGANNIDLKTELIPLLGHLAKEVPLSMLTVFSTALQERYTIPETLNCSDIDASDRFFCAINSLCVYMPLTDVIVTHGICAATSSWFLEVRRRGVPISQPRAKSCSSSRHPSLD